MMNGDRQREPVHAVGEAGTGLIVALAQVGTPADSPYAGQLIEIQSPGEMCGRGNLLCPGSG